MIDFELDSGLNGKRIPGQGSPILFIHGMWGGAWNFENWMNHAAQCGHDVYALNLSGRSGSRLSSMGRPCINDYVQDVLDVITYIERPVTLVGHSLGGLIAQLIALRGVAEKAVFVTSAPSREVPIRGPVRWTIPWYIHRILPGFPVMLSYKDSVKLMLNNLSCPRDVYRRMVPESGVVAREIVFGGVSVPAEMPCPTLVLGGSYDEMTVPDIQLEIAHRLGSKHLEYPNGHMLMLENGWQRPIDDILEFVNN